MENRSFLIMITIIMIFATKIKSNTPSFEVKVNVHESLLTESEIRDYSEWIKFKDIFLLEDRKLLDLPKDFRPDLEGYEQSIFRFNVIFFVFGGISTLVVLLYILLRIGYNKCVGPMTVKQVTKTYKMGTWLLLGFSLISFFTIYFFVIVPSVNLGYAFRDSTNGSLQLIEEESTFLDNFSPIIKKISEFDIRIDVNNYNELNDSLKKENEILMNNVKSLRVKSQVRFYLNVLMFAYMIITVFLGFIFYWKMMERSALVLSFLILIAAPLMFFMQAINSNYFFFVSDYCDSVYQAMYEDKIPIHGVGLGVTNSCHSLEVKSKGFAFNYQLYNIYNDIEEHMKDYPIEKQESLKELQNQIVKLKGQYLDPILTCEIALTSIKTIESLVCKTGSSNSYHVLMNNFLLMLSVVFVFWGMNRLVPVIKRNLYDLNEKLMAEESEY